MRNSLIRAFTIPTIAACAVAAAIAQEDEEIFELSPFTVKSSDDQKYVPKQTRTGTIIAVDRDKIPFTTSVVTENMIDDMRLDNVADFSEQTVGVSRDNNPDITDENEGLEVGYRIRGFANQPLYNGFQTGGLRHSTDSIGRVEISKGANSVLYGQSPAGGVVNFIPKAPKSTDHARVTVGLGSNDSERLIFDTGGPVQTETVGKSLSYRFGGGYNAFGREQIFFSAETQNLYGAVNWQLNDKVLLELTGEFTDFRNTPSRTAAFVSRGSGPDRVVDPFNRDRNDRNFTYNGPHSTNDRDTWLSTAYLTAELTESLTLRLGTFYGTQDSESMTLGSTYGLSGGTTANARYQRETRDYTKFAQKVDILHQAYLGEWSVNTLVGFESHDSEQFRFRHRQDRDIAQTVVEIPFDRAPLESDFPQPPPITTFTELRNDERNNSEWTNARLTQFYTSGDGKSSIMWGLAQGDGETGFTNYINGQVTGTEGDDTTYTAGIAQTYFEGGSDSAINKATFFANYSTSFLIQEGNQQNPADFQGFATVAELENFIANLPANPMDPQTGKGLEIGTRLEMAEGKFGISLLYFDQTRENIRRSFFVRASDVAGVDDEDPLAQYQLASGEENSSGVEIEFDWRPNDSLTLTGGAQLSDGEVVSNTDAPEEVGFGLVRSPETMLNFWANYEAPEESALDGWTFGLGASYNSSTRIRPNINDRWRVSDDYTNARALIRYAFGTGDLEQQINLNIENLLDEEYTMEDNFLSEPRTYKLTYTVIF